MNPFLIIICRANTPLSRTRVALRVARIYEAPAWILLGFYFKVQFSHETGGIMYEEVLEVYQTGTSYRLFPEVIQGDPPFDV